MLNPHKAEIFLYIPWRPKGYLNTKVAARPVTLQVLHYYLTFSFHLKLALLTQLPTSNERKIPPHLKIKPAKFHNGDFTQDLYMHICSVSVKF